MDKTTSSLAWTPALNGIRSRPGGSIRTRWPTPFRALLNQLFGKGKEPFWQQAYTNLVRWIIELHRVFPDRWVTLQQVYRCAIDPELFAAKIEAAEKLSDDLNTGTIFVKAARARSSSYGHLAEWDWTPTSGGQQQQAVHTRPLKAKLEELKIAHEIVWESGPGEDTRERVEAVKRWFVHDWQTLDNKIKSSIVEGVLVFLSMFDMPDVAKVFCPAAPHITDDPQAIILQAQLKRLKAEKDARGGEGGAGGGTGAGGGDRTTRRPRRRRSDTHGEGSRRRRRSRKQAAQPEPVKAAEAGQSGTDGGGAGRQDTRPLNREQPSPYRRGSLGHAPPTADL